MGGNALKTVATRRVSAKEYRQLEAEIVLTLTEKEISPSIIPAVTSKSSFGDIDILVDEHIRRDDIIAMFNPTEIVVNGNVTSFDYKQVQVDIIVESYQTIDFAADYYSYGDLGNLIGRVAARLGLKFGHNGLWYTLRAPDNPALVLDELCVSNSFSHSLELLGYNTARYRLGFYDNQAVFDYVTTSPWFEPTAYLPGNRNHKARVRDKKRPNYLAAVEYFKDKYNLADNSPYRPLHEGERFEFLTSITAADYALASSIASKLELYEKDKFRKHWLNGDVFSQALGISGLELSRRMEACKSLIERCPRLLSRLDAAGNNRQLIVNFIKALDAII